MSAALEITEKEFDTQLFGSSKGLAPSLGWKLSYHTLRSKGSRSGFPDRVIVRERIVFAELKREGGKPTETQVEWLDGLARAGAEAYLWRPSDLDEIGRVLSKRWSFVEAGIYNGRLVREFESFAPASLWITGEGRADGR